MRLPANDPPIPIALEDALLEISAAAAGTERPLVPPFPERAFTLLERAGATTWNAVAGVRRPSAAAELDLVRRVAHADGSVGRIFDGHLNAVERLAVQAPPERRDRELAAVRAGRLRAGVWGGDPVPGEGPPAQVVRVDGEDRLRGVKTFCSGAGGLHRALVLARNPEGGPPLAVWIDLTDHRRVEIDPHWYRSSGLRASASHRVVFHDAPVLAHFGEPGSLAEQPWLSRDALRTAASWVGMADTALDGAFAILADRPDPGPLEGLAAGRVRVAHRTLELWLDHAAAAMDSAADAGPAPPADAGAVALPQTAIMARAAIADACRTLLDEAARACGSRPFAIAAPLDRARRDLEVFLLQHRLDGPLARFGLTAIDASTT